MYVFMYVCMYVFVYIYIHIVCVHIYITSKGNPRDAVMLIPRSSHRDFREQPAQQHVPGLLQRAAWQHECFRAWIFVMPRARSWNPAASPDGAVTSLLGGNFQYIKARMVGLCT